MRIAVNALTNQLSSAYYDANGNVTSGAGATLAYDVSNRLEYAQETGGGIEYYGYAPDNKRVFRQLASGQQQLTFYGARGEKLGVYQISGGAASLISQYVWFGKKLIFDGNPVYPDRLGTNRSSGASYTSYSTFLGTAGAPSRYLPYGEELTSTPNDHMKFGTYTRDSYTGLDYADQRYYASTYGRFNTTDPSAKSAKSDTPRSWNRYAYVQGDPANRKDPRGLDICDDDPDYCDGFFQDPYGENDGTSFSLPCGTFTLNQIDSDPDIGTYCLGPGVTPAQVAPGQSGSSAASPCQNWGCMPAAETQALADLAKPDCAKLFNGHDPSAVLQAIIAGTQYGNVSFNLQSPIVAATTQLKYAITGNWRRKRTVKTATININTYSDPNGVYWNTGNAANNAITLIHELGHVFDWEFGSSSTTIVYDANPDGTPNNQAEAANAAALVPCEQ